MHNQTSAMKTAYRFFSVVVLAFYFVTSIVGVGRYNCHCNHSDSIFLFDFYTLCSCDSCSSHVKLEEKCQCGCCEVTKAEIAVNTKDCCSRYYQIIEDERDVVNNDFEIYLPVLAVIFNDLIEIPSEKTYQVTCFEILSEVFLIEPFVAGHQFRI